jgi:hypothetical protein
MRVVAEYGSRFDADLAVARLEGYGLEASVLADPAAGVAPHHVTDPVFAVVVREEVEDDARTVLADGTDPESLALDADYFSTRFADRPRWVRRTTWLVLAALAGPPLMAACYFAWRAAGGLLDLVAP